MVKSVDNVLSSYGLKMHVISFTRVNERSSSVLGYICSNMDSNRSCLVLNADFSDHETVFCEFYFNSNKNILTTKRKLGCVFGSNNFTSFSQPSSKVD